MDGAVNSGVSVPAEVAGGRRFSLRRANRALVLVRRIVTDVVGDYSRVLELQEILELEQQYGSRELLRTLQADVARAVGRTRRCLEELAAVGVELRDFGRGLVDFPARVAGREIFFCWQLDEERIMFWHDRHEGVSGRRPISELADLAARRWS